MIILGDMIQDSDDDHHHHQDDDDDDDNINDDKNNEDEVIKFKVIKMLLDEQNQQPARSFPALVSRHTYNGLTAN